MGFKRDFLTVFCTAAFIKNLLALDYAESVLFVDYGKLEVVVFYLPAEKGVGSDNNVY